MKINPCTFYTGLFFHCRKSCIRLILFDPYPGTHTNSTSEHQGTRKPILHTVQVNAQYILMLRDSLIAQQLL